VFDAETDARINRAVIGCVSRNRYFADIESFTRSNFNDVDSQWAIGAQVVVVGMSITLIEREHMKHCVNDLAGARWSNNFERNVHGHHDPASGHEVIEVGDVIAMKVSDQDGAHHARQNASSKQTHNRSATAVDHDVLLTRLHQGARTTAVGVGDWATSTEKSDFHEVSMSHK
jgi:hypothetical protein